jgi:CIC family chloride channel protein
MSEKRFARGRMARRFLRFRFRSLLGAYETRELLRWITISLVIGLVAGAGAIAFHWLQHLVTQGTLFHLAGYHPPLPGGEAARLNPAAEIPTHRWLLLVIPAMGGLVSGWLVYRFAPEAEGHGTDAVIEAYHHNQGRIRPVVPFIKLFASVFTIGTGGSAGREGPIAQIGAGFGSFLGRRLGVSTDEIRLMAIIGTGAGIGAIFRAPLGGAIFAAGVLYRETDFEYEALMPGFIASIVAYAVFLSFSGLPFGPIFALHTGFHFSPLQLPFYLLLGVLVVPAGFLYIKMFYGLRDRVFRRLTLSKFVIPALGGLLLGGIAFFYPAVLGSGYGWIQKALDGDPSMTVRAMLLLAFLKILGTSLTIGSGGSGGVFAPSLVIGGMIGGAFGVLLHQWNPVLFSNPSAFILVGMAAFFAAVAKVPIASLIMVSEMTGGYALLVPAMLAIAAGYILSGTKRSIYERQVLNRFASPAHRGDYVVDVLEEIKVTDVVQPAEENAVLSANTPLDHILDVFTVSEQTVFPVTNSEGQIQGVVPLDTLRRISSDLLMTNLIIAHDIMEQPELLNPEDNLNAALQKFLTAGLEQLPVVGDDGKLAGILSRRELLAAYYHRIRDVMRTQ